MTHNFLKNIKIISIALTTITFIGCTTQHTPYLTYTQRQPLAQTSVFMAMNERNGNIQARVMKTDDKDMPCFTAGCPYWVRTLPGNHKFLLEYRGGFNLNMGAIEWRQANIEVSVPNMKPRHVYQANYTISEGKVLVNVIDHGENPDIGLDFSYMGNPKVQFKE